MQPRRSGPAPHPSPPRRSTAVPLRRPPGAPLPRSRVGLRALLLALLLPGLLAACDRGAADGARGEREAADPGYSASDAEILQTGADGLPRYRLQARHIEQDPRSLEVALVDIRLETREGDAARWQVTAPTGRLSGDSRLLVLEGGVTLEGGAAPDAEPLRLRTASLQYDLATARLRAAGPVQMTMRNHVLAGTGLDANLRTRQVRLQTDVHGRFTP